MLCDNIYWKQLVSPFTAASLTSTSALETLNKERPCAVRIYWELRSFIRQRVCVVIQSLKGAFVSNPLVGEFRDCGHCGFIGLFYCVIFSFSSGGNSKSFSGSVRVLYSQSMKPNSLRIVQ